MFAVGACVTLRPAMDATCSASRSVLQGLHGSSLCMFHIRKHRGVSTAVRNASYPARPSNQLGVDVVWIYGGVAEESALCYLSSGGGEEKTS